MTRTAPMPARGRANPGDLSPAAFSRFAAFITGELGIKMPDSKLLMVQSRLLRRVRDLHLDSVDHYAEHFFAASGGEEREHFINAITTNKTDFFRENEHFEYLKAVVLPAWSRERILGAQFKVWSAGCSSGEEAYTLAMVLSEYALSEYGLSDNTGRCASFDYAILGTDVSTRVLTRARHAVYQEAQVLPVPPELRRKYLLRGRNEAEPVARIVPELRRRVSLHPLNFMDEDYGIRDTFDAIFFRNVMIYFDKPTQETVINRMCRNLAPGGYLFAGHSESLAGLDIPLKPVKASIYRKCEH